MTINILQKFIDKIVVHHRRETLSETVQKIEIHYRMIGNIKVPKIAKAEKESYIKNTFRRKKRACCLAQFALQK